MLPILTDPRLVAVVLAIAVVMWAIATRQRIQRNRRRWTAFQRTRDALTAPNTMTGPFTGTRNGAPSVSALETPQPLDLQREQ